MSDLMVLDVRGAGKSWAVYRDGVRVTPFFTANDIAAQAATQLQRRARASDRPCLCCNTVFTSEGKHNRMCKRCRSMSEGMAI